MKVLAVALAAAALTACSKPAVSPATVYATLVDAGCMAPSDDGVSSIAAEHAEGGTPWLECLFSGGSVANCSVPCQ